MTIQPGFSGSSASAAKRAAATSERSGCPRIAAVDPTSTAVPLNETTMPRFEKSTSGACHGPTTNPDDDELSATTSVSENLKAWYRESMSSTAGATAST